MDKSEVDAILNKNSLDVQVWECPDGRTRIYHTRWALIRGGAMAHRSEDGYSVGVSLLADILIEMHGVVDVRVKKYSVQIIKGDRFDWSEFEPSLILTVSDNPQPL